MKNYLKILLLVFTVVSCKYSKTSKVELLGHNEYDTIKIDTLNSWKSSIDSRKPNLDSLNPLQFLELLKISNGRKMAITLKPYGRKNGSKINDDNIIQVPKNWIKLKHLDSLVDLLNDTSQTVPVFSLYANMTSFDKPNTTVGIEAMRLIQGYKNKWYPSLWPEYYAKDTISDEYKKTKKDLYDWWKNKKKNI